MALTRSYLKSMGLTDEQMSGIIEAHSDTVTALKEERDKAKEEAEKVPALNKEIKELKANAVDAADLKAKYDKISADFDAYKADQEGKALTASKTEAYRQLLTEAGISEKRMNAILKVTDLTAIELDKDGKIKGADKLTENIKTEWSDFIASASVKGAETKTPPENTVGGYSKEQFGKMGYQDRLKLFNEHPDVYNALKGE